MQKTQLSQKIQLKQTTAQTVQLMRLVELSNTNLEQEILKEVEENPALEIDDTVDTIDELEIEKQGGDSISDVSDFYDKDNIDDYDYRMQTNNLSQDEDYFSPTAIENSSVQEFLLTQLREHKLPETEFLIAEYLIGSLDDSGYLRTDMANIVMDFLLTYNLTITVQEVENVLQNVVQQFEPVGVGARNLQECLMLQIATKEKSDSTELAKKILSLYFETFTKKQYDKLKSALKVSNKQFKDAINEILKLHPYPIFPTSANETKAAQITPDFIITIEDGKLFLLLNNFYLPKIAVNQEFQNQFSLYNRAASAQKKQEAEKFIKENVAQAKSFISTLNLRELVLYNTMYAIMDKQRAYFFSGNEKELKPMVLKDIASIVNLDISTVSRVSNSKYVQTPFGTISLKSLFSESIGSDDVSSIEVKTILTEVIANENKMKPLADEDLTKILTEKGYGIARRTVAKYREQLNIPISRFRKEL